MHLDCALVIIKHGGEEAVRPQLEQLVARYAWYHKNYEAIVNNPFIKFIRPIVKRLSSDDNYWSNQIPPWMK